jgi:small subunit ribosomal protein S1
MATKANREQQTENSNPQSAHSASSGSTMAKLLASYKSPFVNLTRGEMVEGTVTKLTKQEILVDVKAKSEALVIEKDKRMHRLLMETLHVGDKVMATVINPESEAGIPLVSLRKFVEGKSWGVLEQARDAHQNVNVTITDATKGGYVVVTDGGLSGFLPHSHTTFQQQQLTPGKSLSVSVLELNKNDNKIIFSQKTAISPADFKKLSGQFPVGQKISATIANIAAFGIFVTLPLEGGDLPNGLDSLDGLIHISEIAWDKTSDINEKYAVGDVIEAVVIKHDIDARRVDLSIKRLTSDPFEEIAKQFSVDRRVSGTVKEIVGGAVYVELGEGVEGIIRKEKVPVNASYTVGQSVTATVSEVDSRRHKIYLTPVLMEKPIGYR